MAAFFEKLNFYGFKQSVYEECRGMIEKTNHKHAQIIIIWFMLINLFYFMCSCLQLLNVDSTRRWFFLVYMIVPFLSFSVTVIEGNKNPRFGLFITMVDLVTFETYSVLSSNAAPYTTSWIFLILMVIVALSYIETMTRMTIVLLLLSIIFCRMSYLHKPASIASMDLSNTIVVVTLALILHFAFQRARIQQFVTTLHDIKTQRELEITSSFDALTSLLNRGKFFSMAKQLLQEREGEYLALVLMDLDGFKQINDKLGHQAGDRAIQLAGETIVSTMHINLSDRWEFSEWALREKSSFAGRLGGDEFIILIRGLENREAVLKTVCDITDALHKVDEGNLHGLRSSVGITEIQPEEKTLDEAYKRADDALYVSKNNGKDQINVNQF